VLTWLIVAFFFRYSSLAALVSAVFAPLYDIFMFGPNVAAWAIFAMSALLVWRHRANISKLLAGTESRIGEKKGEKKAEMKSEAAQGAQGAQVAQGAKRGAAHHQARKHH
jgi:glycerol-3-phosphate acyltransferase PlsY